MPYCEEAAQPIIFKLNNQHQDKFYQINNFSFYEEKIMSKKITSALILALLMTTKLLLAQAGIPDPRFINGGSIITYLQGKHAAMDVTIDNNSNIFVSGIGSIDELDNEDFAVIKYFPNGVVDSSFGIDGVATMDFGSRNEYGASIAIQNDGKLVVAGTQSIQQHGLIAVTRFNTDGSVDNTFGTDGKVLFNPEYFSYYGWVEDMLIQPDGKILITGYSYNGSSKTFLAIRLNGDGSYDQTFGAFEPVFSNDGTIQFNTFYNSVEVGNKVLLTQDSKIIIVGKTDVFPLVLKLNSDGSIDNTFGDQGTVKLNMRINQFGERLGGDGYSAALQSDGKILIIGYDDPIDKEDFGVMRLNTDGSIDSTFGNNGSSFIDYAGGNDWGRTILVDSDDNILLGGDFNVKIIGDGDIRMGVARLNPNGTIDNSFDVDGMSYSMQGNIGVSMALSPDTALVLVGTSNNNNGFYASKFLTHSLTTDVQTNKGIPNNFVLEQNYPNPFNPSTTIQFAIPKAGEYKVIVYNTLGQQVAELLNTQLQPGVHKVQFDASQLASGIYIYQLSGSEVNFTKKMILMK